ncbi:type-2 angiotensin II receptor-like [Sardina pilchardus]|uniref:type-2 angiotensin II receptor-like n=1 Tax=Sardina pilchardus TaxID=27697 RepID=UPI002E158705
MATLVIVNDSFGNVSIYNEVMYDDDDPASCHHVVPPAHQRRLIPAVFALIFLFGAVGNSLVLLVLCRRGPGRRTVASTYMVNLALSDLLFLLCLPFWAVQYALDYHWPFGAVMCKACSAALTLNLYASIFFITCMSADRYLAIVQPLRSQSCRRLCRARVVSGVAWLLAGCATVPALALRDTVHLGQDVTACVLRYPSDGWVTGLALSKTVVGFLLPLVVIVTCYCGIGRHLLAATTTTGGTGAVADARGDPDKASSGGGGGHSSGGANNVDHVLRMVVAVVLAFFLCWFPFHTVTLLDVLHHQGALRGCWVRRAVETLLPFTICLGFSNSAVNPFLYCFVGNHFREQLGGRWGSRWGSKESEAKAPARCPLHSHRFCAC